MGLGAWGLGMGDLGCRELGWQRQQKCGLVPADGLLLLYRVRCLARSWVRCPIQVCPDTKPLGLGFPLGRIPSAAEAAVLDAPSRSFLAAPQVTGCPDSPPPGAPLPMPAVCLSSCLCFRTQRSATMRPTTSPRSATFSTSCRVRCCSSSRPTTCCGASRPPWAPAPAPPPSSTCHVAASRRWPRECGLRPLLPSSSPPAPGVCTPPVFPPVPRAVPELPSLQLSLQEVRGTAQLQ